MSSLLGPAGRLHKSFGRSGTNGTEISPAPGETTFRTIARGTTMQERGRAIVDEYTVEQVADLLDEVYAASGLLAYGMDRILGYRTAASRSTIDRFTRLADQLRPGSRARAQLSEINPSRVLAGTKLWQGRNRERSANSSSGRAAHHWSGKATA